MSCLFLPTMPGNKPLIVVEGAPGSLRGTDRVNTSDPSRVGMGSRVVDGRPSRGGNHEVVRTRRSGAAV